MGKGKKNRGQAREAPAQAAETASVEEPMERPGPAGPGRPVGSRNEPDPPVCVVEPSRCLKCGSMTRSDYWGKVVRECTGMHNGRPYSRVVWRRCRCLACGQTRVDKEYL